jgi:nucleoside-diphosphate-sugar epimerase
VYILITGGAGFVGSELAVRLIEKNHRVVVMDNLVRRGSESNLERLGKHGVTFVHGDVRNPEDFANLPDGIEFVCDTSAQPSVVSGTPIRYSTLPTILWVWYGYWSCAATSLSTDFFSSNRVYVVDRLLELPRREAAARLEWDADAWKKLPVESRVRGFDPVHGVSEEFATDGGQRSIYGLSKLITDAACQEYAHAFDMPIVVNRFGVIAGSGQFAKLDQGWVVWWAIAHYFAAAEIYRLEWQAGSRRSFLEDVPGGIADEADGAISRRNFQPWRRPGQFAVATRRDALIATKARLRDHYHHRRRDSQSRFADLFYRQPQSREGHKLETLGDN